MIALLNAGRGQEAVMESITVSADRVPDPKAIGPFATRSLGEDDLRTAPQLRLDDILRAEIPGFSLFRRSSSRVANPTTQGVTLRNFGPSGAGRTLVLLDGIPMNDPFAGYVQWNQLPPAALESVIVTPGGGAGLFGNAALAGTIFLRSQQAQNTSGFAQGLIGNADTYGGTGAASLVDRGSAISIFAERFSTGGYPVVQANQRGPVDNNASADSNLLQLGSNFALDPETSLKISGRLFEEERGNGTIYTRNETRGADASVGLTRRFPQLSAELALTAYYQHRKFQSTFSSVNATRTVETPALDQFDVPADAVGGSAVWTMPLGAAHTVIFGADARWVEGETNEAFRFIGGDFTRLRQAGGQQMFVGVFAEDTWKISPVTMLVGGMRLDRWELFDGSRDEFDRATGNPTLTSSFPDRDGYSLNGRVGAIAQISDQITLRAAAYTGFRVPTLNELYRPFRVGNVVTEANAALDPERLIGGEAGFEWHPLTSLRLRATGFYNRLENAIGNITVGFGPGTFDPCGFIPAGGVLRQRRNIDLVTAPGFEFSSDWQIAAPLSVRVSYLFTTPRIDRASESTLVGRALAQTPEHVVTAGIEWRPGTKWLLTAQGRYTAQQFEDDQNAIVLAPFFTVDAAVFYELTNKISAGLKAENLFDADTETGKKAATTISLSSGLSESDIQRSIESNKNTKLAAHPDLPEVAPT
jgi:outer membrane receptor protein involved in Fe transport